MSGKIMGEVIDFQKFKESRIVKDVGFTLLDKETACPFCTAPTSVEKIMNGTSIHTYNGVDMEKYYRLKELLSSIVERLKSGADAVEDEDIVKAFGEGMREFLKELEDGC